ncbi:hypothetical protein F900_01046 [Acinetobacter modestus]|uniref:Uncharacterized protein n=1 Tax=Acinetobacter modestus TaxID=1776740 RepID=N9NKU1_9GAMM|nr:hypothetical protein [Acinetobacter modestus]ENX02600.1 hypothetical protein F900_01046 [Acinetobacter modestus]
MKLILVLGIWNYNLDTDDDEIKHKIEDIWIDSLKEGLKIAKLDSQKLNSVDIELVYFGDLYRKFDTFIADSSDELEAQMLAEEIACEIDKDQVDLAKSKVQIMGPGNQFLKELVKIIQGKFPFIDSSILKIFCQETDLYFNNKKYYNLGREIFFSALKRASKKKQKIVVVGHSQESVISYDLLVNSNEYPVNKLITLGLPLAIKNFNKILKSRHEIEMPKSIKDGKWFNTVGIEDFVSLYPLNGSIFRTSPTITNIPVQIYDHSPHDIRSYLSNPIVASEIYMS